MNAVVLFTVEVFGVLLRVLECQGKRWLLPEEIASVLEYRSSTSMGRAIKPVLADHTIKARIHGVGQEVRIIDESGLLYICGHSPRPGAAHLRRWLADGGMQALPPDANPVDSKKTKYADDDASKGGAVEATTEQAKYVDIDVFEIDSPTDHAGGAISNSLPTSTQGKQLEHEKAYCRDLLKTMLRYCSLEDVDDVRTVLDDQIDSILRSRHCPGLNAARYELYRRYWIRDAQSGNGQEVQS